MTGTGAQDPGRYTDTAPEGRGHRTDGEARGEIDQVGSEYGSLAEMARQSALSLREAQLSTAAGAPNLAHPGTHAAGRADA
jgi:hypothetical protein